MEHPNSLGDTAGSVTCCSVTGNTALNGTQFVGGTTKYSVDTSGNTTVGGV